MTDYTTVGGNPLQFTRSYNSLPSGTTSAVSLGGHWRSNFDRYLTIVPNAGGNIAYVERADGRVVQFQQSGSTWSGDTDVGITLTGSGPSWTLTDSDDTVETYTSTAPGKASLTSIVARGGYTQTLTYNGAGQLAAVTDTYKRTLGFYYTGTLLTSIITADGTTLSYGYTSSGANGSTPDRLASISYATNPVTSQTYLYENPAFPFALTSLVDEKGVRFTSWTYDTQGRALTSAHAGGADLTTITYNNDGSRTVTNALGQQEVYKFVSLQGVQKLFEVDRLATPTTAAASRRQTYDQNGYIASITDWNGNLTSYTNDPRGLPQTVTEAVGTAAVRSTVTNWETTLHVPKTVTTAGLTSSFTYDKFGNLHTKKDIAKGLTRTWTFDWQNAHLIQAIGPRTDVVQSTTFGYGAFGRLASIVNALGQTTKLPLGSAGGRPTSIVDPNGVTTTLGYDPRLRLTAVSTKTAAGNLTTRFSYDPAGNRTEVMLPDGSFTASYYDDAHRLTGLSDALKEAVGYALDANGDRTGAAIATAGGSTTWQDNASYDALGRVLVEQRGAGQQTAIAYDNNGNPIATKDSLSRVTALTFDALNRVATVTDPAAGVTKYTYDAHDRITSVKAPNGATTTYIHDGFGRVTQRVSPDTGTTSYIYDLADNLVQSQDGAGVVTYLGYDALDRIIAVVYPADSAENVAYSYDQPGHGFGIGHLTSLSDAAGTLALTYDERGNQLSETRASGSIALATGYTYDAASRVASITYPSGTKVSYVHDKAGQVQSVAAAQGGATSANIATAIKYMPFGPIASLTYGNGIAETRTYDLDYRLHALTTRGVQSLTYSYNLADDVTAIADGISSGNSQALGYDLLDHLNAAAGAYGSFSWTYDGTGNRATQIQNGVTSIYGYQPNSNVLAGITSGGQTTAITTSGAGNILSIVPASGPDTTPMFNQAERLASVSIGGTQVAAYTYDGLGQRFSKTTAGGQSLFQYDPAGYLLEEADGAGYAKIDTIYLNGSPVADITQAATFFLHTDRLGTPQAATTTQKAVAWRAAYQPFGLNTGTTGLLTQNLRSSGQYADAETGWHQNGFRDYVPSWGRYLESDPIGLDGGINSFTYVEDNPFSYTDHLGTCGPFTPICLWALLYAEELVAGGIVAAEVGAGLSDPNYFSPASTIGTEASSVIKSAEAGMCNAAEAVAPEVTQLGGAYRDVRGMSGYEAHHMPANSISPLSTEEGPSVAMLTEDHHMTASWGNSREARAYRQNQADLIAQGEFQRAQQLDITDIQTKFGTRYDDAIQQMLSYTRSEGH